MFRYAVHVELMDGSWNGNEKLVVDDDPFSVEYESHSGSESLTSSIPKLATSNGGKGCSLRGSKEYPGGFDFRGMGAFNVDYEQRRWSCLLG